MPKTRPPYPQEFRRQILELIQAGRTPSELAREFEPSGQTIRTWMKQAEAESEKSPAGMSAEEQQELARLREENRQLRLERDILAKAAAWFARETGAIPDGSSRS